jgi:hypothetical protein
MLMFNADVCVVSRYSHLLAGHQPFPRATESQLNSKRCGKSKIYFSCFDFLKVARGDFGAFGQFFLGHFFANPFAAHVCAESSDPFPFFFRVAHIVLHAFSLEKMNDTGIVKHIEIMLAPKMEKC